MLYFSRVFKLSVHYLWKMPINLCYCKILMTLIYFIQELSTQESDHETFISSSESIKFNSINRKVFPGKEILATAELLQQDF